MQSLVFIHGVGGSRPEDEWLTPLSNVMAQLGSSRPDRSGVDIRTISYQDSLLTGSVDKAPPETWKRLEAAPQLFAEYQVRRSLLEADIKQLGGKGARVRLGMVPDQPTEGLAILVEQLGTTLRQEAFRYRKNPRVRAAVIASVLDQMPTAGSVVIVAHSLGSVIALDLIKRLPGALMVDGLVTVGSPLSLNDMWRFLPAYAGESFPVDRVRSWVNVFDSWDPVTAGRGVGTWYPEALDVDVHFGSRTGLVTNHGLEYYLSLPAVGIAVSRALFGSSKADVGSSRVPVRDRGRDWDLHLLGAAFAKEISTTCSGKKHAWRRNFDAARNESVLRLVTDAEAKMSELAASAQTLPTASEFLDHAAGLVRGTWSDEELLPLAVGLLMASPVRPFEIKVDERHAEEALRSLGEQVRMDSTSRSAADFARAVASGVDAATDVVGGRSNLWAWLLIGGAAVLAATGVGLAAAAPAGLAGAALLTSTLAAFGPGGMVGGMLTIAAASSAGSALLGAGASQASKERALRSAEFADNVASLPIEQLRAALAGWVAAMIAERKLGMPSSAEQVRVLLLTALARIVNEENAHNSYRSSGARAWKDRRELIQRVLAWLDEKHPEEVVNTITRAMRNGIEPVTSTDRAIDGRVRTPRQLG